MNKLILGLFLLLGTAAQALPCSGIYDIKIAPAGTKCTSSSGQVFEKVVRAGFTEAWRDPSGLIWSESIQYPEGGYINRFYEAWDACADRGAYLPLVSEGLALESSDPLPHARSYEFWTAEVEGEGVRTIQGQHLGGGTLGSRTANTICVDDLLVKIKKLRPAKPVITIPQGGELESPIRDNNGRLIRLTKTEARRFCHNLNKRLPTFEQFVAYAVSRGARGLVDKESEGQLFNSTFSTVRGTYIFDGKGYIWNQPATDDVGPFYWIDDDATTEQDPSGRYNAYLFNRSNGIGLFFIHNSSYREEFVCSSL